MILLTFLGTGNYLPTTYQPCDFSSLPATSKEPQPHRSKYFSAALAHWTQPHRILVITTAEASAMHEKDLRQELADFPVDFLKLPLQTGTESDLWAYFQTLTNNLPEGEELIADITHGFRSTPLVTLLALSYLRVTRKVNVLGVYYGAFDAVSRDSPSKPTFDLSPFLNLLHWTSAADSFFQTGDATSISQLIEHTQSNLWGDRSRAKSENPRQLIPLARTLRETSANLRTLRLQDLANSTEELTSKSTLAQPEISRFLPPFGHLVDLVTGELLSHRTAALTSSGKAPTNTPDETDLHAQLNLIRWLLDKGHPAAALTLAREWIVTAFASHLAPNSPLPLVYSQRKPFETLLNFRSNPKAQAARVDPDLLAASEKLPAEKLTTFETLWSKTTAPRNDLNHANHNETSHKASSLHQTVESLLVQFGDLLPE